MKDRMIRHPLWKWGFRTRESLFQWMKLDEQFTGIRWTVRAFYLFVFVLAFGSINELERSFSSVPMDSLWPLELFSFTTSGRLIGWLHLGFLLLAGLAVVAHKHRLVRLLLFLGLFFFSAASNSFGKVDHGWHLLLFCSFFFIFLDLGVSDEKKRKDAVIFASAQFFILFTYSLSGFWKLIGGISQWRGGQTSIFSVEGLSNQIAHRLLQTDSQSIFGDWLIRHEWIGFVLMLGAVYLELCSVLIIFRPRVHRLWGLGLISMHLSIILAMTIGFSNSVWVVGLLFVLSPFAMKGVIMTKGALTDLPIIGNFFLLIQLKRPMEPSVLFYDGECGTCNHFVQTLLRRGKCEDLHFAPLQGETFAQLESGGDSLRQFDSLVYFSGNSAEIHTHSRAVFLAIDHCSSTFKWWTLFLLIPREVADLGYLLFAPFRKRVVKNSCMIPTEEEKAFLLE